MPSGRGAGKAKQGGPKRETAAERRKREAEEELEKASDEAAKQAPDGIFVGRVIDPETGDINVAYEVVGDVRLTEIPTILGLAYGQARARFGQS